MKNSFCAILQHSFVCDLLLFLWFAKIVFVKIFKYLLSFVNTAKSFQNVKFFMCL